MATEAFSKATKATTGIIAFQKDHTVVSFVTVVALTALTTLALSHFFVGRKLKVITSRLDVSAKETQSLKAALAELCKTISALNDRTPPNAENSASDAEEEDCLDVPGGAGVGLELGEEGEGAPPTPPSRRRANSDPNSPLPPVESTSALAGVLDAAPASGGE